MQNDVTINNNTNRKHPIYRGDSVKAENAVLIVTLFASRPLNVVYINMTRALRGSDSFSRFRFLEQLCLY